MSTGLRITLELAATATHGLKNKTNGPEIAVGIDCTTILLCGSDIPRLAENETKRKERWRRDHYNKPGICQTTVDDLENRGKL